MLSNVPTSNSLILTNLLTNNSTFFFNLQKYIKMDTILFLNQKHLRFSMLYLSWNVNGSIANQSNSSFGSIRNFKKTYKNLLQPRKKPKLLIQRCKPFIINPNLHLHTTMFDLTTLRNKTHLFLGTKNSYRQHSIFKAPHLIKDSISRKLRFLKKRIKYSNKRKRTKRTHMRKNTIFFKKIISSYLILLDNENLKIGIKKQPIFFFKRQLRSQKIWKRVKKHSKYTPSWRPNVDQRFYTRKAANFFTYKSTKPVRAKNFKWRNFTRTKNFSRFTRFALTRTNVSSIRTAFNTLAQKSYKIRTRVRQRPTTKLKFYYNQNLTNLKINTLKRASILSTTFLHQVKNYKTISPSWRNRRQRKKLRRFKFKTSAPTFRYDYRQKRKFVVRKWKRLKRILRRRSKRFMKVRKRNYRVRVKNFKIYTQGVDFKKKKYIWKLKKVVHKKKLFKRFYRSFFSNMLYKRLRYRRAFKFIRWRWIKNNKKRFRKRRFRRFLKRHFFKKRLKRRNRFKRLRVRLKRRYVLNTKFHRSLVNLSTPDKLTFHKPRKLFNLNGTKFLFKKHFYKVSQNKLILKIKNSSKWFKFVSAETVKSLTLRNSTPVRGYFSLTSKVFLSLPINTKPENLLTHPHVYITPTTTSVLSGNRSRYGRLEKLLSLKNLEIKFLKPSKLIKNLDQNYNHFEIKSYAHHFFNLSPLAFFYSVKQRRDWQNLKERFFKTKLWLFFKSHFDFMDANEMKKQFFRNVMSKKKSQTMVRFWKFNPYKLLRLKHLKNEGNVTFFYNNHPSSANTRFSSEINHRLRPTLNYKTFYTYRPVHYRVRRIRYKPGYSTQWRRHRRKVLVYLRKHYRFQHRLTLYLQKLYFQNITTSPTPTNSPSNLTLGRLLLITKFSYDVYLSNELIKHDLIFLNGFKIVNPLLKVFQGDIIQFIVNFKFYLTFRWLKIWSARKLTKIKRYFYKKTVVKQKAFLLLFHKRKTQLPTWIYDLEYAFTGIPHFLEMDYFTLSVFIIDNPNFHWTQWKFLNRDSKKRIFSSYNWKYIN